MSSVPPTESKPPAPGAPDARYAELIARESEHWGRATQDPSNPQLWDDPVLYRRVLAGPYEHLLARAVATGGPVLELGCGDGDLALELARRRVDATGLDLSPVRIERARAEARRAGLEHRAHYEVADLNTGALPPGHYACVVAHDALHHILHVEPLLDRVREALRPDGTLIVSDFIGAGWFEKLISAGIVALLPTVQPYAAKWRLRGRLRALLASEADKRASLESGGEHHLHDASPFESITQGSIVPAIAARFAVTETFTFCPWWYHAVPRLRLPPRWKRAIIGAAQHVDGPLNRRMWTRGSYVFVEARRR